MSSRRRRPLSSKNSLENNAAIRQIQDQKKEDEARLRKIRGQLATIPNGDSAAGAGSPAGEEDGIDGERARGGVGMEGVEEEGGPGMGGG